MRRAASGQQNDRPGPGQRREECGDRFENQLLLLGKSFGVDLAARRSAVFGDQRETRGYGGRRRDASGD